jgi:hypothetical protein
MVAGRLHFKRTRHIEKTTLSASKALEFLVSNLHRATGFGPGYRNQNPTMAIKLRMNAWTGYFVVRPNKSISITIQTSCQELFHGSPD